MSLGDKQLSDPSPLYSFNPSDQQQAIIRSLSEKSTELAYIYIGTLRVLIDRKNPDRFHQSAHSIRELIEKLPRYWPDAPSFKPPEMGIKSLFNPLIDKWISTVKKTCCADLDWTGIIDPPLTEFLRDFQIFITEYQEAYPSFRKQTEIFLKSIAPFADSLPHQEAQRREKERLKRWMDFRSDFNKFCHHNKNNFPYIEKMKSFESMLASEILPPVTPPALEDLQELDQIIQGIEKND